MIRRAVFVCLLIGAVCALDGISPAQMCRETKVGGRIKSGELFSLEIGAGLAVNVEPLKENKGWFVRVSPKDSQDDWAWPSNLPLHSANAQYMGAGFSYTMRDQLRQDRIIYFPATEAEYLRLRKLAESSEAKTGDNMELPNALHAMRAPLAEVTVEEFDKRKANDVEWMRFQIRVIVPEGFPVPASLSWHALKCPERE